MVNKHFLKRKLKNINGQLRKSYKAKFEINSKIQELEQARTDVKVLINGISTKRSQKKV